MPLESFVAQKLQEKVQPSSISTVPTRPSGIERSGFSGGPSESRSARPRGSAAASSTASSTLWTLRGVSAAPKSAALTSLLQLIRVRHPATTSGLPLRESSASLSIILSSVGDLTPHVLMSTTSDSSGEAAASNPAPSSIPRIIALSAWLAAHPYVSR